MSQEFKVLAEKKASLMNELSEITEQLNKIKKDNLCIRLAYERWRQTYESLNCLKKNELSDKKLSQETFSDLQT